MKRTMPWSDDDDSSNDESSSLHSDSENDSKTGAKKSKGIFGVHHLIAMLNYMFKWKI